MLDKVTFKDKEQLTLFCLSLFVKPIKKLIKNAKKHNY
jgi:hypothetical protein